MTLKLKNIVEGNKWKVIPWSCIGTLHVKRWTLQSDLHIQRTHCKNPSWLFFPPEIDTLILKFMWKGKSLRTATVKHLFDLIHLTSIGKVELLSFSIRFFEIVLFTKVPFYALNEFSSKLRTADLGIQIMGNIYPICELAKPILVVKTLVHLSRKVWLNPFCW